jgi:hypothetical protein
MDNINFNLQLFAEGGDGGAAAGADGATGVTAPDAGEQRGRKRRENPLANVRYGIQPQEAPDTGVAAGDVGAAASEDSNTGSEPTFDELVKGKYKQDFDARVQDIIRQRFKANTENEQKLTAMNPLMEMLGKMYNVDPTDIDAITNAVGNTDSLYEEEAAQRGMSVESLKTIKQLERERDQAVAQQNQTIQEQRMRQHFDGLAQQAEQVKQLYPDFDLLTEMQNPTFARLTAPNSGIDVRTAYEAVHRDELRGAEMQFAAQRSAERVANAVRSNSARPVENGLSGQQGASVVKTDPRTFTTADRREIRDRVRRGEKIIL